MACCTEIQNDGNKVIKQGELKIAVGTGTTTGDTSSTNGNTRIKLAISGGSVLDSAIISGAGATTVTSDNDGNIIIESPQLVDPSISGETENLLRYLNEHPCCTPEGEKRQMFLIGADTYQLAPFQVYNYFAGNYNDGIRIHCPIFKNDSELSGTTPFELTKKSMYDSSTLCGSIFMPKFFETGIVLAGYDNPCSEGGTPKTWTIYNNGGHLSIARNYNHSDTNTNYIRCEVAGCNTDYWPDPSSDDDDYEAKGLSAGTVPYEIRTSLRDKVGPETPITPLVGNIPCPSTSESRKWYIDSDWVVGSDRRLKDNIKSLSDNETNAIWDKSDDLIKTFNLKSDPMTKKYGVIAQEVQEVIPSAVSGIEGEDSYLHVEYNSVYGALIGTLIKKVKELEKKVEELEKK